jgi:hypothetical protein
VTRAQIMLAAQQLAKAAEDAGFNVTIERRPLPDLAMGNTEAVVEVWPLRHPPAAAKVGV